MKVLYQKIAEDYLFDLIEILYQKEYFGFYESAETYVDELIDEILTSIDNLPQKTAPPYFQKIWHKHVLYNH